MPHSHDLNYQLIEVDGTAKVLWSDGRVHPIVRGGDGSDDGGEGGEGDGGDGAGNGGEGGEGDNRGDNPDVLQLTQAELDQLIERRMGRARKQWEAEAAEKAKRAEMGEVERLQAELEDARNANNERVTAANQRLLRAEATSAALSAGVPADRVNRLLRLVDLDGIDIADDGTIDPGAVATAVEAALVDVPELRAVKAPPGASSGDHNDSSKPPQLTRDQLRGMKPAEILEAKEKGQLVDLLGA